MFSRASADLRELARRLLNPITMMIAISHWHGRVAPVFDVADNLQLVKVENSLPIGRENIRLTGNRDSFGRAHQVAELGVHVLLCGAVSHTLETALIGAGIRVIAFLCGEIDAVLEAYLQNRMADSRFIMPGHHAKVRPGNVLRRPDRRVRSTQSFVSTSKPKGGY